MNALRSICTASFLALLSVAGLGCGDESNSVDDSGKTVSSVEITPGIDTLKKGEVAQFTATAKFADGSSKDVTRDAETTWNTSDAENATVDKEGKVTAVDEGTVDITAKYAGVEGEESFLVTP